MAAIGFGAYTYYSLEHRLYEEVLDMQKRRVAHLRDDIAPIIRAATPESLAAKIQDIYSPEQNDRFIRVSKSDGAVLYVSGPPLERNFDPALIPVSQNYADMASEHSGRLRHAQHILLAGLKTRINGGDYILEMGTAITPVEAALHKLALTLLFSLPIIALIAAVGGALLLRRALRPVETMRATAEQISFGKLRQRLPLTHSGDAIDHLAQTLNQMLDRLDLAYEQASRFSADASHEIRTPLSIMRGEMEGILHDASASAAVKDRIGSVLEETERLSAIVETLFSLARLDAGEAQSKNERCDLSELARSTLNQMQLLADEKNISVKIEAARPVYVSGDAARLRQIIVNLLDNAIKYTMPGGSVTIAAHSNGQAVLTVRDNGMGIPPDALPHVFERFYRADKARSRAAAQGAGLGLSIVRAICQAHGGSIVADSQEGVGTTLTVTLPTVP